MNWKERQLKKVKCFSTIAFNRKNSVVEVFFLVHIFLLHSNKHSQRSFAFTRNKLHKNFVENNDKTSHVKF